MQFQNRHQFLYSHISRFLTPEVRHSNTRFSHSNDLNSILQSEFIQKNFQKTGRITTHMAAVHRCKCIVKFYISQFIMVLFSIDKMFALF